MRVYVIGGPGAGKTTYATQLAKTNNVSYLDLDTIKWISNGKNTYIGGRSRDERVKMLSEFLKTNSDWVCDGVYYTDWINEMLFSADCVTIIQTPLYLRQWRVLKRAFKNWHHGNETINSLIKLMKWNHRYDVDCMPEFIATLHANNIPYGIVNYKELRK